MLSVIYPSNVTSEHLQKKVEHEVKISRRFLMLGNVTP